MASQVPPKPNMKVYGGSPPKPPRGKPGGGGRGGWWRRRPRWVKITVGIVSALLVVVIAVGAATAWYLNGIYDKITALSPVDKKASKALVPTIPTSNAPITVLIVGSDHRGKTVTGQFGLSDTLMLLRIDPKHHAAALFSIPRDLWVTVPGYGTGKINGAYSAGGNALALKAVKQYTGVHPNYLINIDFSGFRGIVDSLGGVYVNVDQYYYNPPATAPYSGWSEIDIQPGYQQLKGRDALAFSRYRHTDDDFHREARQQLFLRAFESRAANRFNGVSVTDIPDITNLLNTVSKSFTIIAPGGSRPSISTLVKFVATAYGVRSQIASVHAPFGVVDEPGGASAVDIDPAALQKAIAKWKRPWTLTPGGGSLPSAHHKKPHKPKWRPAVAPAGVAVTVLNGNGVDGDASKAATQLSGWGYGASSGGNAPKLTYPQSIVYYKPGQAAAAADVAHILGSADHRAASDDHHRVHAGHRGRGALVCGQAGGAAAVNREAGQRHARHDLTLHRISRLLQAGPAPCALPGALSHRRPGELGVLSVLDRSTGRGRVLGAWSRSDPDVQHPRRRQGRELDVCDVQAAGPRGLLGHRGDAVHRRADPAHPQRDPKARRSHLPLLLQRLAHPDDRIHSQRAGLLGPEHAHR